MNGIEALEIGHFEGAERWLRLQLNEDGGCSVSLIRDDGTTACEYPCSLETLRLISRGMSYQASSPEGYLTITTGGGCLNFYARTRDDRKSWTHRMQAEDFVTRLEPIQDAALARNRGYMS